MWVRNIGDRNLCKRFVIKSFFQVLFLTFVAIIWCPRYISNPPNPQLMVSETNLDWDPGLQNANYVQPISLKRMPTRSFKPEWSKMISEKFSHTALEQGLSRGLLNYVADLRQRGGGREEGRGGQPEEQEQSNHLISPLWSFIHCIGGWISVAKF